MGEGGRHSLGFVSVHAFCKIRVHQKDICIHQASREGKGRHPLAPEGEASGGGDGGLIIINNNSVLCVSATYRLMRPGPALVGLSAGRR